MHSHLNEDISHCAVLLLLFVFHHIRLNFFGSFGGGDGVVSAFVVVAVII